VGDDRSIRDELRSLPVFASPPPAVDYDDLPDSPRDLFREWLRAAIQSGALEPHSMTLSTVDSSGAPDARILILKDQVGEEWRFASSSTSAKGMQLQANRDAALTFYWPNLSRQVRIRGRVHELDAQLSQDDFLARGLGARSAALASSESTPLEDRDQCVEAVSEARQRLIDTPNLVAGHWALYSLTANQVEFWQADVDRLHHRIQYLRRQASWDRGLLWP
jgi:pyridoxamine 5'-phosphate oxidase